MKKFTATIAVEITNMNMDSSKFLNTTWIYLPQQEEDIEEKLEALFAEDETQSYSFTDIESTIDEIRNHINEFEDIYEVNEIAEIIEAMQDFQREAIPLILTQVNTLEEAIEIADRIEYMILDHVANEEDLGIEIVRMNGFHTNIPVELEPYIDYGIIGQDAIDAGVWSIIEDSNQAIAITL